MIPKLRAELRELRKEMKAAGIRRVSCFNGGLSSIEYHYNARMFELESKLIAAKKEVAR